MQSTRQEITKRLLELDGELQFTQFTVHTLDEESKKRVKELAKLIESINFSDYVGSQIQFDSILQKIITYYAFFEREEVQSLNFLTKLKSITREETIHDACLNTLIGYANTIDPGFRDVSIFEKALAGFPKSMKLVAETNNDFATLYPYINKAMALRYLGLMHHRQAIEFDKTKDQKKAAIHTEKAFANIQEAIELESELEKRFPLATLSLAESLHIKGVMHIRCGELTKDRVEFEKALAVLADAAQKEKAFCTDTKAAHFLMATTMQSLAKTYLYLNKHVDAIRLLKVAYNLQVKLFNTKIHPDIAKTLHFKGDVYANLNDYSNAIDAYLDTLVVRKQIIYRDSFLVDSTIKALKDMLTKFEAADPQACFAKYKQVYSILAKVDANGEFIKQCYNSMVKLQSDLSAKVATDKNIFSPHPSRKKEELPTVQSRLGLN